MWVETSAPGKDLGLQLKMFQRKNRTIVNKDFLSLQCYFCEVAQNILVMVSIFSFCYKDIRSSKSMRVYQAAPTELHVYPAGGNSCSSGAELELS